MQIEELKDEFQLDIDQLERRHPYQYEDKRRPLDQYEAGMVSLIDEIKTGLGQYQESHKNENEHLKRAYQALSIKETIICALKSIDGDDDKNYVRDTKIQTLFEIIQDVVKDSNDELYDQFLTPGFNPQENCVTNLPQIVKIVGKLIQEQAQVQYNLNDNIIQRHINLKTIEQIQAEEINKKIKKFQDSIRRQKGREIITKDSLEVQPQIQHIQEKYSIVPAKKRYSEAVEEDRQYKKRYQKFYRRIENLILSYTEKMELIDENLDLQEQFPCVKGFNQWPKISDVSKLDVNKFKTHMITDFEFYDLIKNNPDNSYQHRISFRLYTATGEKSPVSGLKSWSDSTEAFNSYLTKVDLNKVKKISVVTYKHSRNSVPRDFVSFIAFYDNNNNISHLANAVGMGTYTIGNFQANLINNCPGNGYQAATYEIPDDSKIVAFKYTDFCYDQNYYHLLLDFEPLIMKKDFE